PSTAVCTDKVLWSISGVCLVATIWVSGTPSNHTVCQMPVTGVYQMPWGRTTCLPFGWGPSLVGSHTPTTISCCAPFAKYGVMSKENGSYPPSCEPTFRPFTYTSHCQSTAPKCKSTRCFRISLSIVTVCRYQSELSLLTVFPTPESADSTA